MAAITGQNIGKQVCEALGLDHQKVQVIDLHIASGELVTVNVQLLVQDHQADKLIPLLREYELHRKVEDVTPLGSDVAVPQFA